MRTDFISQRDPADENDYWYAKFGYSVKGDARIFFKSGAGDWVEQEFDSNGIAAGYLDRDVVT